MNEITKAAFPSVPAVGSMLSGVKVNTTESSLSGGVSYLQFNFRDGQWTYGQDREDVNGEEVLIFTDLIAHGWVLWCDSAATKIMVPCNVDLPEEIPAKTDRRNKVQTASEARSMTGAFADGVMFQWDTNSMGGRQAVNDLLIAIMQRYRAGETLLYPKVKLSGSPYFNKTRQEEIWNPKLEILGWADRDGNETASEAKLSPPVEAPPHDDLTQTEVPGTTAAEEPAAEEPVRRKRRSAA